MASQKASPLHICAERGFVEIAESLLKNSPQLVHTRDQEGNLPLHVACEWDQVEVIKMICDAGTDEMVKAENGEGKTPVDVAYEENTQQAYVYLCDRYKIKKSWSVWCSIV